MPTARSLARFAALSRWIAVLALVCGAFLLPPPTPARAATINVAAGGSLQTAVNNAKPGDVIRLAGNTQANETVNLALMGSAVGSGPGDLTIVGINGASATLLSGNGTRMLYNGGTPFPGTLTLDGLAFSTSASTTTPAVSLANMRNVIIANSVFDGVGAEGCASGVSGCVGLYISAASGTPAIALYSNIFRNTASDAVHIEMSGSAQAFVTAYTNTFDDNGASANVINSGLFVNAIGTSRLDLSVSGNSFSRLSNPAVYVVGNNTAAVAASIVNNTITNMVGTSFGAIDIDSATGAASSPTLNAIITDNTIDTVQSQGILVQHQGNAPTSSILVQRNTIQNVGIASNKRAISISGVPDTKGSIVLDARGNTIANTGGSGIRLDVTDADVQANVRNNTLSNTNSGAFSADAGIFMRSGFGSTTGTLINFRGAILGNTIDASGVKLSEYTTANASFETSGPASPTYIQNNNTFNGGGTVQVVAGTIGDSGLNSVASLTENSIPAPTDDTGTAVVGTATTLGVLGNDTDGDAGDGVNLLAFQPVSARGAAIARDDNGTPASLADDQLTFTPIAGGVGSDTFYYTVRDNGGRTSTRRVTVNVANDTTPPTADIVDVTPDPRGTSVASIAITFSENVTGLDLADLSLSRDGTPVALTGATISGSGASYILGNLTSLTSAAGSYVLTLTAAGSGIADAAGNALAADASDGWVVQPTVTLTAPTATAAEGGATGTYRVTRSGTSGTLAVGLAVNGTSTAGASDYALSGAGITGDHATGYAVAFANGQASVDVTLTASDDVPAEAAETLRLDLASGAGYVVGTPDNATVTIAASDTAVTATADSGEGSLRQAITNANAFAGTDTVTFALPGAAPWTIDLTSALPNLTGQLTIDGPGASLLTVRRNTAANFRIFAVPAGADVTLRGLTANNGNATDGNSGTNLVVDEGGGIRNDGTLLVDQVTFDANRAEQRGGAIHNTGTLTVTASTLNNNSSLFGAAIYNQAAATVRTSTFGSNTAATSGGAIYVGSGTITVVQSTFSGNTAGTSGSAVTAGSTTSTAGTLILRHVTIAGNSGGNSALRVVPDGAEPGTPTAIVSHSIIARNTETNACNISGVLTNQGFNLSNSASCTGFAQVADPRLGPLADNGGPTLTYALLPDSPAINAGDPTFDPNAFASPLTTDQRGLPRVFNGTRLDIGAFEAQFPIVAGIGRLDPTPTASATVALTVTFSDDVTGVDASDFQLNTAGVTGAGISAVAGGPRIYTVTVNTGTGDGSIRLDVLDDDTILTLPAALQPNVPLGGAGTANGAVTGGITQTYTVDKTLPTVALGTVAPDPRNSTVASIAITFSENVTGLDLADLALSRDGTPVALTGATISGTGANYSLGTLAGLTGTEGTYTLTLTAAASGIADSAGNALATDASESWTLDTTAPTVALGAVVPDPRNTTVVSIPITFSESVAGLDLADLSLSRDGTPVALTGATISGTGANYSLDALDGLTGTEGTYTLTLTAAASGIADSAGNALASGASESWRLDTTAPNTAITGGPATNTSSTGVTFAFTGADNLTPPGSLTFACALDGAAFAPCTSTQAYTGLGEGSHTFAVRATDEAGNTDATPASFAWTVDASAPDTTITSTPADPANSAAATFAFSGTDNLTLVGDLTFACALDGAAFAPCTSTQAYTGLGEGNHTFAVRATDEAGNTDPSPASFAWTVDLTAPSVTINQAPGQADPASAPPFGFVISFSEAVSGFTAADLNLAAGTAPGTLTATLSGGPMAYTATITGMTGGGTVIATIPAGAAQDAAGNGSGASTSSDNTVTFAPPPPSLVSIVRAGPTPTNAATVAYTVSFDLAVTGVDAGDFSLATSSGQGGATISAVAGTGTTWAVSVTTVANAEGDSGLNLLDDDSIRSNQNAPLSGAGTNGGQLAGPNQTYRVDRAAPRPSVEQATGQSDPTGSAPIGFTITFTEPVTGLSAAGVVLGGTAPGTLTATLSGGPSVYSATVSGMTGSGTISLSLGAAAARDQAGNASLASFSADNSVAFSPTLPVVTGIVPTVATPSNGLSVAFRVTFSEPVVGVDAADFVLGTSDISGATVGTLAGSGAVYTVTVATGTGSGVLRLDFADDDTVRASGSGVAVGGTGSNPFVGQPLVIDRSAPLALRLGAADVITAGGATYSFTVAYSDNLALSRASLGGGDLVVSGPGGFSQAATLLSATPLTDGVQLTATYQITAPGGAWDRADSGTYSVTLQADQVRDTVGNQALPRVLGSFGVSIGGGSTSLFLPLMLRQPGGPQLPDLIVERVAAGPGGIAVTIRNQGVTSVRGAFWVDVYIDPSTAPTTANQTWPTLGSQGAVWGVTGGALPLDPGEALTLTLGDAYYRPVQSVLPASIAAGTRIFAQVDSANATTSYGGVLETHEQAGGPYNNITAGTATATRLDIAVGTSSAGAADTSLPQRPPSAKKRGQ